MKILIVTPFPPCPGISGGATAVFNLVKNLSRRHTVICLTFSRVEDLPHLPALVPYVAKVITVPYPGGQGISILAKLIHLVRRVGQNIISLLTLTPVSVWKSRRLSMVRALREVIEQHRPNVVHICFPQMAQYVDYCLGVPTVMDTQDVAVVSAYRRVQKSCGLLAKGYHFLQWLFWIMHETIYYRKFDKILTLTQQDAAALRIYNPDLDIYVGAIGVDIPSVTMMQEHRRHLIGFLANFAHPPNIDATLFFLGDVFPLIQKEIPGAEFVVAGRTPPAFLRGAAGAGVRFVGYVDDVCHFYGEVDVVVAPLRFGGGIKIKVLEALACGRPVVATSVGAEGIAGREEGALLIADDPSRFAACVCRLLEDAVLAQKIGVNGRSLVAERFSWERVVNDLEGIYARLVSEMKDEDSCRP
ncbi:MAG: glycosyltransferase family 4 protein [Geoalkalibacter sp.]|uniref:glycosyltransferase family 4 protein n=1 Tax=Geoalkalibacter sp. TaxID=3041440 RepID=UPI003D13AE73